MNKLTRRRFLNVVAETILASSFKQDVFGRIFKEQPTVNQPDVVHIEGGTVYERIKAAVDALGGISKFVRPNATIVIKPNAAFAQTPEMGGNTTPEVIGAVIKLCKQANAKSVTVVEHCLSAHGRFSTSRDLSGITQIALREGALVFDAGTNPANYTNINLNAPNIHSHGLISKFLEADVVINVPRAKTHPWAGYTLCAKNLMGTMQNPKLFHRKMAWVEAHWLELLRRSGIRKIGIGRNALPMNLVALAKIMQKRVALNIVDMTDLVRDWSAERPGKLEPKNTIIAGTNMVSVDAYCVKMFGENPLGNWKSASIDNYIRMMHEAGIGNANIQTFSIIKSVL